MCTQLLLTVEKKLCKGMEGGVKVGLLHTSFPNDISQATFRELCSRSYKMRLVPMLRGFQMFNTPVKANRLGPVKRLRSVI
jgi:hypothetical protein